MAHKSMKELEKFDQAQLVEKVDEWRKELFQLRISKATSHIKDYSQFRKLRKNIARGMTRIVELHTQEQFAAIYKMIMDMSATEQGV